MTGATQFRSLILSLTPCQGCDSGHHLLLKPQPGGAQVLASVTYADEFAQKLDQIVGAVPGLGPGSRVLDAGSGSGALIPHLQSAGVADVLAVDPSAEMLDQLRQRFDDPGTLGNEPGVRS